jgi:hypothetical protein
MSVGVRVLFDDARVASTTVPVTLPDDNTTRSQALQRVAVHVHKHAEAYLPRDEEGEQVTSVSISRDAEGHLAGTLTLRDGRTVGFRLRAAPR